MSDSDQKPKATRANYAVPAAPGGDLGSAGAVAIASDVAAQAAIIEAKTEGYQERAHA